MLPNEFNECFDRDGESQPSPPQWLERLTGLVIEAFHADDVMAPIGCHVHREDEEIDSQWEVTLFVSHTEFFGGAYDGQRAVSRYMLDLKRVMTAFDIVESFYWQAQSMAEDDQLGPHIGLEGEFEGNSVWLRITSEPPTQFEAGRTIDVYANVVEDNW